MGTAITLEVGGLTLTYNKNHVGWDHGTLFQERDRQPRHSEQINYEYYKENQIDPGPMEMAFARPLREVIPRIALLGFTLDLVRHEYERAAATYLEERRLILEVDVYKGNDEDDSQTLDLMSFDEFCAFATQYPVGALDDTFISDVTPEADSKLHGRFHDDKQVQRIPHFDPYGRNAYSERSHFGELIGILHPYSVLCILGLNSKNLEAEVVWQYGPLVDAGWANASEFIAEARRTETFLVATEGSSDVHILKHCLSLLKPEIADFFRFIDVNESHPFSGAGNLLKFAEGLVKIDVHNQVLFVFDNDAEGHYAYKRLVRMKLPNNMRAMLLPELEEFRAFLARGPEGVAKTDINRRAAAIECYLDLNFEESSSPRIHWTNYKAELDVYHGALEHKESYTKRFMRQTAESLKADGYNTNKLRAVLEALISECCNMRTGLVDSDTLFKVER